MHEKCVAETLRRRCGPTGTDMNAYGHAELLSFGVKRVEIRVIQIPSR